MTGSKNCADISVVIMRDREVGNEILYLSKGSKGLKKKKKLRNTAGRPLSRRVATARGSTTWTSRTYNSHWVNQPGLNLMLAPPIK